MLSGYWSTGEETTQLRYEEGHVLFGCGSIQLIILCCRDSIRGSMDQWLRLSSPYFSASRRAKCSIFLWS